MPVVQVRPAFVVVAQPMLLEPPPTLNRPVWKVATTVLPKPNESGSTWVLCWLDWFVYGSALIGVATTLPPAAAAALASATAMPASRALLQLRSTTLIVFPASAFAKSVYIRGPVAKRVLERDEHDQRGDADLEVLKRALRERAAAISVRERELEK